MSANSPEEEKIITVGGKSFTLNADIMVEIDDGVIEKDWKIVTITSDGEKVIVYKEVDGNILRKYVPIDEFLKLQNL